MAHTEFIFIHNFTLKAFLVLSRIYPRYDLLKLSLCLALREVVHVVVLRCSLHQPLRLDVRDCADVVFGGEDELVVQNPLWFVVQARRRVKLHDLVVLHGQVMTAAFQVSNLKNRRRNDLKACSVNMVSVHD